MDTIVVVGISVRFDDSFPDYAINRLNLCKIMVMKQIPSKRKTLWINGLSKVGKEIILELHKACSIRS